MNLGAFSISLAVEDIEASMAFLRGVRDLKNGRCQNQAGADDQA